MVTDPITFIKKLDPKLMDLNMNTMMDSIRVLQSNPYLFSLSLSASLPLSLLALLKIEKQNKGKLYLMVFCNL